MPMAMKRHLRLVKDQIKPEEVSLDTSHFEAIPDEDALDILLDEVSDEEFGSIETKDAKPVKLKEWKAEEFASIYVRFRPHLERHARKWLSNQSQIDEVVQDAFLYLMVSLPELDSEIGVLKFMKWKVKNLCLDIYRASGRAYIKSIDDISEPIALNAELGSELERAEDAAVVRLALSKLNPRHREVLLASIYEEKTTAEIAAQVGLSENATLQLLFRARGAFKKALLGDVDTNGMSMGAILSVAARKAAEEAKKVGVQAMVLVLFLAVSVGAFFNFNGSSNSVQIVADAPALENNSSREAVAETGTSENPLKVSTVVAVRERPEVPLAIEEYDPNVLSNDTAKKIVASNLDANISVFRASRASTTEYMLEAANGVRASFSFSADSAEKVSNLVFTILADGIEYQAYGQDLKLEMKGSKVYVVGYLSYLMDGQGHVFDQNALAKASFQLEFDATGGFSDGKLSIYSKN
jgi:RNA polymerase sigma-70 factor (ECF subfamily)